MTDATLAVTFLAKISYRQKLQADAFDQVARSFLCEIFWPKSSSALPMHASFSII